MQRDARECSRERSRTGVARCSLAVRPGVEARSRAKARVGIRAPGEMQASGIEPELRIHCGQPIACRQP